MRRLAVLAVSVLVTGLLAAALAGPLVGARPAYANGKDGDVGWRYSEAGRGYYQDPVGGESGGSGDGWVYLSEIVQPTWDCNGRKDCADNSDGDGTLLMWCRPDQTPQIRQPVYVKADWRYRAATRGDPDKWEFLGVDCYPTPEWVPIEEVRWHFSYEIRRRLPAPTIELNPQPRGLVNLPVIVSTPDPGPQDFAIVVPPSRGRTFELHGTIHAVPDYTWTFEDGGTVHGAGRPYDGTDPRTDPGHYVTDTFARTGIKSVHLRVRWTGTVTVQGLAPEPIRPVVFERDATVEVVESWAALKDGPR